MSISAPDFMTPIFLVPALTPHGHLVLAEDQSATALDAEIARRLHDAFARGSGHGLLQLGAGEVSTAMPAVFAWWREFGARYVSAVCAQPERAALQAKERILAPDAAELSSLALGVPPMPGAEYLTPASLAALWQELDAAFERELAESRGGVQDLLKRLSPAWNLVGRVHFNLAENRNDEDAPFAFLATYTRLSSQAHAGSKVQHLPLGQALREYAGVAQKDRLLSLLVPVQRAAEDCPWLRSMIDAGEIFQPLRWTPADATQMLEDVPQLERAGVVVRMPAAWNGSRPARPRVSAKIGGKAPTKVGLDTLLDFRMEVVLDGETLTAREIKQLLVASDGLALVRGRWVEVDSKRLQRTLDHFSEVERAAAGTGLSFREAMRMLAGANVTGAGAETDDAGADGESETDWSQVVAGPWLSQTLAALRTQEGLGRATAGAALKGTLRAYQQTGLEWLHLLANLGLGACLADDMGLGKTIQVLALLLVLKQTASGPSLLVAPASLLANWAVEAERFAPSLRLLVAHPSAMPGAALQAISPEKLKEFDLVVTSYGSLLRVPCLGEGAWNLAILDEAQAIKNPAAKQTRAVKKLNARARLALTGTPVENRLGDLWSIFDFINPGLLGSAKQFSGFTKRLANRPHNLYGPLRELTRPYILRRLKTDKTVIVDLPEKTEVKAFCQLSRKQAALYQDAVDELASRLDDTDGVQRKGMVLAFLMLFKQICNHPSQWLGDGAWAEEQSGKWARLREIAQVVAARQEKMLVFTQFREVTSPLAGFLAEIFGRAGLVLHGDTPVKKRQELVERFQKDESVGFFVLSLKAGGAGLNLTAASHVVHFDRWWNPAVENQATDRAFRIGQKKNVLVHKFVCRGTVEDKIDQLIESKLTLAESLFTGGADQALTEMKDDELLKLVRLDIHAALKET